MATFVPLPGYPNPTVWYPCVPAYERETATELAYAFESMSGYMLKSTYDLYWAINGGIVDDYRYNRWFTVTLAVISTIVIDEVEVEIVTPNPTFSTMLLSYLVDPCWNKTICVIKEYPDSPIPFRPDC